MIRNATISLLTTFDNNFDQLKACPPGPELNKKSVDLCELIYEMAILSKEYGDVKEISSLRALVLDCTERLSEILKEKINSNKRSNKVTSLLVVQMQCTKLQKNMGFLPAGSELTLNKTSPSSSAASEPAVAQPALSLQQDQPSIPRISRISHPSTPNSSTANHQPNFLGSHAFLSRMPRPSAAMPSVSPLLRQPVLISAPAEPAVELPARGQLTLEIMNKHWEQLQILFPKLDQIEDEKVKLQLLHLAFDVIRNIDVFGKTVNFSINLKSEKEKNAYLLINSLTKQTAELAKKYPDIKKPNQYDLSNLPLIGKELYEINSTYVYMNRVTIQKTSLVEKVFNFDKEKSVIKIAGVHYRLVNSLVTNFADSNSPVAALSGYDNNCELLLLNPKNVKLKETYDEFKTLLDGKLNNLSFLFKKPASECAFTPIQLLKTLSQFMPKLLTSKDIPAIEKYQKECFNDTKIVKRGAHSCIPIENYIEKKLGVCRHHALIGAYLLDKFMKENPEHCAFKGKVQMISDDRIAGGGAHAWLNLICEGGRSYTADTLNGIVGDLSDTQTTTTISLAFGSDVSTRLLLNAKEFREQYKL